MDFTYLPTSEMDFLENTKYATDHKCAHKRRNKFQILFMGLLQ